VADGRCVVSEFQTTPVAAGLASQSSVRKSAASPPCPSATHVLLFCNGSGDSKYTIRQTAAQLLLGDRLTVLSVQDQCDAVVQGDALQTLHGSILLSAAVLAQLGLPPAIERSPPPPPASSTSLPLFMLTVHSGVSTVREKPLPATCFDSFAQLYSCLIVNAPDLSSTCIDFEGTLAGRHVRVLLDSGASANFVNSDLVHELSLPIAPISSPVTVRVADGRISVVKQSVTADLWVRWTLGSLACPQNCTTTTSYWGNPS
jgi:hypothetical protein